MQERREIGRISLPNSRYNINDHSSTSVNGQRLREAQIIFGTPKLEYPYADFDSQEYQDFDSIDPPPKSFILSNKWNGFVISLQFLIKGQISSSISIQIQMER